MLLVDVLINCFLTQYIEVNLVDGVVKDFFMYTRLFIFFFLLVLHSTAQTSKIDRLREKLSTVDGRAQVDILNVLGLEFNFGCIHSDSALKYAGLAYQKATLLHYDRGKAISLTIQADVQGRLLGNPKLMEQYSRQAIELLKSEMDSKNLSIAYYKLALALALQGLYEAAHDAAHKARQIAIAANDKLSEGWAIEATGFIYAKSGKYWKAFENLIQSQQIGKELNDSLLVSISLALIGRSFNRVGDPQKALDYYHQSLQFATPFLLLWPHLEDIAYAHMQLKQYDSAVWYQQKHSQNLKMITADIVVQKKFSVVGLGYSVDVQLAKKQYDRLLEQLVPTVERLKQSHDVIPYMQTLLALAKLYEGKRDYKSSILYARQLYLLAQNMGNRQFLKEGGGILASAFHVLKQGDSAYYYLGQYTSLKDSMETAQFAGRTALYMAASEAENKIRLMKKDKEINEQQLALNKKELQKQSQLKNVLLVGFVLVLLFSFLVVRNILLKRKNEKLQNEQAQLALKRKALELEMQALRAQMNPHFIFNCLSAIDNLIQTNQPDKATSCLSQFARLIRGVLDSSKNNLVSFQKDFETLQLYLQMEQFRCNNKFNYQLHASPELLDGDYKIPPLIIQPFIENAIHHGLLNKQDNNRQLQVEAQLKDEHIIYSIIDNGIGRKKAAILKGLNRPGQQSYGIDITRERIQLHNKNDLTQNLFITDLEQEGIAAGTKAVVTINCSA